MAKDSQNKETDSIGATADRYGISRNLAFKLAREGKLPGCLRLGKRLVVVRAVTDKILQGASQANS